MNQFLRFLFPHFHSKGLFVTCKWFNMGSNGEFKTSLIRFEYSLDKINEKKESHQKQIDDQNKKIEGLEALVNQLLNKKN